MPNCIITGQPTQAHKYMRICQAMRPGEREELPGAIFLSFGAGEAPKIPSEWRDDLMVIWNEGGMPRPGAGPASPAVGGKLWQERCTKSTLGATIAMLEVQYDLYRSKKAAAVAKASEESKKAFEVEITEDYKRYQEAKAARERSRR